MKDPPISIIDIYISIVKEWVCEGNCYEEDSTYI